MFKLFRLFPLIKKVDNIIDRQMGKWNEGRKEGREGGNVKKEGSFFTGGNTGRDNGRKRGRVKR